MPNPNPEGLPSLKNMPETRLALPKFVKPKLPGDGALSRSFKHSVVERMLTSPKFCYLLLDEHAKEMKVALRSNAHTDALGAALEELLEEHLKLNSKPAWSAPVKVEGGIEALPYMVTARAALEAWKART